ncbi:MAG TPA: hypothetical protein VGE02_04015 [Gemmatimonadales bacterium]
MIHAFRRTHAAPARGALALAAALVSSAVVACSAPAPASEGAAAADTTSAAAGAPRDTGSHASRQALLDRADKVVEAIARRDWGTVAAMAHPERGVRFSPYGHVETGDDCAVTLGREQLASLATDSTTRCWGHFDGTGEPITMTFPAYYERFVHDRDYEDASRGEPGERLGQGNTLSNIPAAFGSDATFVEYHVPGTEEYGGMDWGSLRLVFVPSGGEWRLVGVVHDQWTI